MGFFSVPPEGVKKPPEGECAVSQAAAGDTTEDHPPGLEPALGGLLRYEKRQVALRTRPLETALGHLSPHQADIQPACDVRKRSIMKVFRVFRRSGYVWQAKRCRSLRDLLLLIGSFTLLSLYICYHLDSMTLPVTQDSSTAQDRSFQGGKVYFASGALKRSILSQSSPVDSEGKRSPQRSVNASIRLEKLMRELEEKALQSLREQHRRSVIVRGKKSVILRDLPLYKKVLEKRGFFVHTPQWFTSLVGGNSINSSDLPFRMSRKSPLYYPSDEEPQDWLLMLCMTFGDRDTESCFENKMLREMRHYQRINRIPGLRSVLSSREALCTTINEARKIPGVLRTQLMPPCFVLPSQYQQFLGVAETLGSAGVRWVLKPIAPRDKEGPELLDLTLESGRQKLRELGTKRAVVQQFLSDVLTMFGQPISVRLFVLVTSMAPLRAYVHSQGLVHHHYNQDKNFRKMSGRTWLLSELWNYVAQNYGLQAARKVMSNIHDVLLQTLLITEAFCYTNRNGAAQEFRCEHCFQLLGVDLIFNNSLYPVVLEVKDQPNLQESPREEEWKTNNVRREVLEDTVAILFPTKRVADIVAETLQELRENVGIMGVNCHSSHELCLTERDLLILMDMARESTELGGFRKLYPAMEADEYEELIGHLQQLTNTINKELIFEEEYEKREYSVRGTAKFHPLVVTMEQILQRRFMNKSSTDKWLKSALYGEQLLRGTEDSSPRRTESNQIPSNDQVISASAQDLQCSADPSTMPYLAQIFSNPRLQMSPPFSPFITEYFANVSYDQLMIRVWALAKNCQCEVRIDDKYGASKPSNYTLGVGDNLVTFLIVDVSHNTPWVINSYSLLIHRRPLTYKEQPFDPYVPHQVCSLTQDCDMRVSPTEPCGIFKEPTSTNWTTHLQRVSSLPLCDTGDAPGRWVLPCYSCANAQTCFWQQAAWFPYQCQYKRVTRKSLSKCLAGKKLLFLGDSTNRGMMHYLMERLNGTLAEWDKTHDIRVHSNLNDGRTTVSFAYYPQFWLPVNQRPVFDKTLYQLLQRSQPLENNSNTILVVGGVQWLATQHLYRLLQALRGERLQGIKLVMKTLGAGFHQPLEGVHCLTLEEQRKLLLHSRGLAEFAKYYNFEVIDTFNITIPRYKDFLQGKCACHFHKVTDVSSRAPDALKSNKSVGQTRYHVEGPINAIYSEILLSRICQDYVDER